MNLPLGFEGKDGKGKMFILKKIFAQTQTISSSLFSMLWVIKSHNYCYGQADHTMFYIHKSRGKMAIVIIHVDV